MDRTANRPPPAGRMSVLEALCCSVLMGCLGVLILWLGINACAEFSVWSVWSFIRPFTRSQKRVTPSAVLIGAFLGAFRPCWAGWLVR